MRLPDSRCIVGMGCDQRKSRFESLTAAKSRPSLYTTPVFSSRTVRGAPSLRITFIRPTSSTSTSSTQTLPFTPLKTPKVKSIRSAYQLLNAVVTFLQPEVGDGAGGSNGLRSRPSGVNDLMLNSPSGSTPSVFTHALTR